MAELKKYCSELYTLRSLKTKTECMDYLQSLNFPKLSNEDRLSCEGKLTLQECWKAVNSMKNCKTPGNDGLTKECFVCFFNQLGKLLVSTLNYSFDHGEMSTSQKQAIIVLMKNMDRDSRLIKNWRPISLMNVDAKIASKALAMRVEKIIYKLVYIDQTAYIKGRFIGESVRLIEDLLEYVDQENEDGILFAADIEKAFDSVEHSFIYATLKKFGFGGDFIQWIRTLLNDAQSCVVNNEFPTGYFKLQRGNRRVILFLHIYLY